MTQAEQRSSVLNMFVERARQLYSLPAVAMQVLELTNHPMIDVRRLKQHIETDPALTAKILRVVNSSLFGLRGKIGDLNQAIALLGVNTLRLLVLGFSLPPGLFENVEGEVLRLYWRHSLVKSIAARELAKKVWKTQSDMVFTSALMQDIGVLVLVKELGEPYSNFYKHAHAKGGDILKHENDTLGFDHSLLSVRLLSYWGLPEEIVHAVGMPFDESRLATLSDDKRTAPRILHLAELVARCLVGHDLEALKQLLELGERYQGMTANALSQIVDDIQEAEPALAEALDLEFEPADYQRILEEARVSIEDKSEEAIRDLLRESGDVDDEAMLLEACDLLDLAVRPIGDLVSNPPGNPSSQPPQPLPAVAVVPETQNRAIASVPAAPEAAAPKRSVFERRLDDMGLLDRIAACFAEARRTRQPISVALVELDQFESLGPTGRDVVADLCWKRLREVAEEHAPAPVCVPQNDMRLVMILPGLDRADVVGVARWMTREVEQWPQVLPQAAMITLSVGIASIAQTPRTFPPQDFLDAAERCLYGARNAGGNSVKSIDLI